MILAVALGILVGSGFLGDPLLDDLERRVDNVVRDNNQLRALAGQRRRELDQAESWVRAVEPYLVRGALDGTQVVLFTFDGTEGSLIGGIEDEIARAGGSVVTTVTIAGKFSIENAAQRDELALVLRSVSGAEEELRSEAGRLLGSRAADVAKTPPRDTPRPDEDAARLESFLAELQKAGFIAIDTDNGERMVPEGSSFVVVGGGRDDPPFEIAGFVLGLTTGLAENGAEVVTAEPLGSAWPLVDAVRDDPAARDSVSTVDSADVITGRIALVLSLSERDGGVVGHYGFEDGAGDPLPQLQPAA